jgi:prepilin-type N-terminal cleavage/methylation domain-containing protein
MMFSRSTKNGSATIAERGFSLMELLIVLVIIGIMTAVAAPNIDIGRYRVESAMQTTGTLFLAAQRAAITSQHDVIILFDEDDDLIRILRDTDNDGVIDSDEIIRNYPLGENVTFGRGSTPSMPGWSGEAISFDGVIAGLPAVTFHRNGSSSEAGGFYMMSRNLGRNANASNSTRAIEIDRATGRTSWYRYAAGAWQRGF